MTPPNHRLPAGTFAALSRGGGGTAAIHRLRAAQQSKNLMLLRSLVALSGQRRHPEHEWVRAAYQALRDLHRRAPEATIAVLGYPPVSAWAMETVGLLDRGAVARTHPGFLAAVAAAAAVRGGVPLRLVVPIGHDTPGSLALPSLGTAAVAASATSAVVDAAGDGALIRCAGAVIAVPGRGGKPDERWRPVPVIRVTRDGIGLTLAVDGGTWRYAPRTIAAATHPIDPGPVAANAWGAPLAAAWDLLVRHHRPAAREVAATLGVLAPVPAPAAGLNSGTFHNAFGCVAMSVPTDHRLAALALTHEVQHAKLAALMDLLPLITPGPDDLGYAPWRDDPRPLAGLLHGAYAHLGVARFWRGQRHQEDDPRETLLAEVEFVRWTAAAHEVARMLCAHPRLTPVGQRLVGTVAQVLTRWRGEAVSAAARAAAGRQAEAHRAAWIHRYASRA